MEAHPEEEKVYDLDRPEDFERVTSELEDKDLISHIEEKRLKYQENMAKMLSLREQLSVISQDLEKRCNSAKRMIAKVVENSSMLEASINKSVRAVEVFLDREVPVGFSGRLLSTTETVENNDRVLRELLHKLSTSVEFASELMSASKSLYLTFPTIDCEIVGIKSLLDSLSSVTRAKKECFDAGGETTII